MHRAAGARGRAGWHERVRPIRTLARVLPALAVAATLCGAPRHADAYPGEARVLAERALKEYRAGKFEEAAKLYDEAVKLAPELAELKLNLGSASYKQGKSERAVESFKGVFDEMNPALTAAARYNMGVVRDKEALAALKEPAGQAAAPAQGQPVAPGSHNRSPTRQRRVKRPSGN